MRGDVGGSFVGDDGGAVGDDGFAGGRVVVLFIFAAGLSEIELISFFCSFFFFVRF